MKTYKQLKFIDLFAGLGGFHVGFDKAGFECVFACEIDDHLRDLYKQNHNITPHDDIRTLDIETIPEHDVICAGFPCQPFSLAGKKKGAKCPESGRLIDDVIRIANHHKPKFIILENVPNILTIAEGSFWEYLTEKFSEIGYNLEYKVISPVEVGIPQNRKRVFIVAYQKGSDVDLSTVFNFMPQEEVSLENILNRGLPSKALEDKKVDLLKYWQKLLDDLKLPEIPALSLVAPEFGATYPINFTGLTLSEMKSYKGAYGASLADCDSWEDILDRMPSYTRKNKRVANWLHGSVQYSRSIYAQNSEYLDQWSKDLGKDFNSWQILEWRGQRNVADIYQHLVQFRASGIRILKREIAPSLISMTPTQIPVIPDENRYISEFEAARLQFLDGLKAFPETTTKTFKAMGNAVNAKIVELIASNLREKFLVSSA